MQEGAEANSIGDQLPLHEASFADEGQLEGEEEPTSRVSHSFLERFVVGPRETHTSMELVAVEQQMLGDDKFPADCSELFSKLCVAHKPLTTSQHRSLSAEELKILKLSARRFLMIKGFGACKPLIAPAKAVCSANFDRVNALDKKLMSFEALSMLATRPLLYV